MLLEMQFLHLNAPRRNVKQMLFLERPWQTCFSSVILTLIANFHYTSTRIEGKTKTRKNILHVLQTNGRFIMLWRKLVRPHWSIGKKFEEMMCFPCFVWISWWCFRGNRNMLQCTVPLLNCVAFDSVLLFLFTWIL